MSSQIIETLKKEKIDFTSVKDLEPLIEEMKDKKVVMLGEASHGTHEYYNWRARISKVLIEEHGFKFISVEGDWPPLYELNRYIKNYRNSDSEMEDILRNLKRWPQWMWSNFEVMEFADWLTSYNSNRSQNERTGFYGLDVYSLWESLDAIMEYLKKEDPSALKTAEEAMKCFEPHRGDDGQRYAQSTYLVPAGCQKEVTRMLSEISSKSASYNSDPEHAFSTEQNAIVAKNAEEYYRVMVQGGESTWNLRDRHMMDTLDRLLEWHGNNSRAIVWAHNTHVGDASYTDMSKHGLFNIGQLARETYGEQNVFLAGFGAYKGSVLAGDHWGAEVREMMLPNAPEGTWEHMCHSAGKNFAVLSEDIKENKELENPIPHRAVGVVYHPDREKHGNYVPTNIPGRYDGFIFFDESRALHPLATDATKSKIPETYPFGV